MNIQTNIIERGSIANRWAAARDSWFLRVVLGPFIVTRLAWILAGMFAMGNFLPNPVYLERVKRGGLFTKITLLDIFARFDSGWYMSIVRDGYNFHADISTHFSNLAFYPLYPFLVKSIGWLGIKVHVAIYLAIGLLISNLCFLAAMVILYRLARTYFGMSEKAARRAILLLMVFPGSFYFSTFYTESLYLFLSLLGFWAAIEKRWWLVGLAGALVSLTRIQGLLVVGLLGLIYLHSIGWRLKNIRADILWFGLVPLAVGAHMFGLYQMTGLLFTPLAAQRPWGRGVQDESFFVVLQKQLAAPVLDVFKIDAVLLLFFLGCGIYLLFSNRWRVTGWGWVLGLYVVFMCVIPISNGMLMSVSRFLSCLFPVFLVLGEKLEQHEDLYTLAAGLMFALQVTYFAAWSNWYFIG